jgi:hypothetical protein
MLGVHPAAGMRHNGALSALSCSVSESQYLGSGSDVRLWHFSNLTRCPTGVRIALQSRHRREQHGGLFKEVTSGPYFEDFAILCSRWPVS